MTSYVFRDLMEKRLDEVGVDDGLRERLLEHTEETARASYLKSDLTRTRAEQVKKSKQMKKKFARK